MAGKKGTEGDRDAAHGSRASVEALAHSSFLEFRKIVLRRSISSEILPAPPPRKHSAGVSEV
jgi:hypothetical protein